MAATSTDRSKGRYCPFASGHSRWIVFRGEGEHQGMGLEWPAGDPVPDGWEDITEQILQMREWVPVTY